MSNKNKSITRDSLFIGFIAAFSGVALCHLSYALDNVNAIPTEPLKPGASGLSPGISSQLVPPNPVYPGASELSPRSLSQNSAPT